MDTCAAWSREFEYHYRIILIINISWVNYLDSVKNEHSRPGDLEVDWKDKMEGHATRETHPFAAPAHQLSLGCFILGHVSCGPLERIEESYTKWWNG